MTSFSLSEVSSYAGRIAPAQPLASDYSDQGRDSSYYSTRKFPSSFASLKGARQYDSKGIVATISFQDYLGNLIDVLAE